ncbi:MAG: AIM24 family protein [Myxococcales bacterium]|nr:MAG: AIM24 family protein [Myxococcales bacterium]
MPAIKSQPYGYWYFDATPLMRIMHGHPSPEAVGGSKPLVKIHEKAFIVLEKPRTQSYYCIDLAMEKLCIKESALVAFSASLNYRNSRLPAEDDNQMIHLQGKGKVILALSGKPKAFPVPSDQGIYLSPRAVIGWTGTLLPVLDTTIQSEKLDNPGLKLCLRGEGSLLTTAM